jgi:hypothetical protein
LRDSKPIQTMEAQCGSFRANDKGWREGENISERCSIEFPRTYLTAPKLLFGISTADAEFNKPRCISMAFPEVKAGGFSVRVAAWSGCRAYEIGCNWLTLPDDLHLETGRIHTYGGDQAEYENFNQQVFFSQSFASPPIVCVWFQEFEWHSKGFISIKCGATEITSNSFNLKIDSWANRKFKNARVQYIAYPAEENGKRVKSGRNTVVHPEREVVKRVPFYGQPFNNQPKTFIAISELDFSGSRNLRFRCSAIAPNNKELDLSYGTWWDTEMHHAEAQWIAIE